jgi:hypothetical protein
MKTYFIVNTCILDSEPSIRDEQYKNGISKLIELTKDMENIQIIIVENNGGKQKYLEDYNNAICTTFYTNNNRHIETGNIGIKELIDVIHCISRFDIGDDDFIVKMNGRYVLNDDSEFIAALKNTGIVQITNTPTTVQEALVAEEEPTVQDASVAEEAPTVPVEEASVAEEEAPTVPVEEQTEEEPTVPVQGEPTVPVQGEPTVPVQEQTEEAPTVPVEEASTVPVQDAPTIPVEEQTEEEAPTVPVEEQSVEEESPTVPVEEAQAPDTSIFDSENEMTFEFDAPKVITTNETHCIIKYGSYDAPLPYRTGECISAIIGMRGKYAKQINIPRMEEKVENVWAAASLQIDEENIVMLEKLGINVCPGGNDYFLV